MDSFSFDRRPGARHPAPQSPTPSRALQAASAFFAKEADDLQLAIRASGLTHPKLDQFCVRLVAWVRDPNLRVAGTHAERSRLHDQIQLAEARIYPERETRTDEAARLSGESRSQIAKIAAAQIGLIREQIKSAKDRLAAAERTDDTVFSFLGRLRDQATAPFQPTSKTQASLTADFFVRQQYHRDTLRKSGASGSRRSARGRAPRRRPRMGYAK